MCSQFRLLRLAPTHLGGPADRDGGEADPGTSVKIGDMVVARSSRALACWPPSCSLTLESAHQTVDTLHLEAFRQAAGPY
jgi:hypothetical protein